MRIPILSWILLSSLATGSVSASVTFSSSVEIKKGFIVLDAQVDGVAGHYILDSGAPGLILNRKYLNKAGNISNALHGIHGGVATDVYSNWTFEWNDYEKEGNEALAIDLSYLEKAIGQRIDGLVGIDVFEGYHVVIDYSRNTLQLWTNLPVDVDDLAFLEMQVQMESHVPVVTLWQNDRPLRFAFDSGSGAHILDKSVANRLSTSNTTRQLHIVGADQQVVKANAVSVSGLTSAKAELPPTEFILTDLSGVRTSTDINIDGILGQPFFENRIIIFDRNRKSLKVCSRPQEWTVTRDFVVEADR